MDKKNPRAGSAGASLSIAADIEASNQILTIEQGNSQEQKPYVSFSKGPDGRTDRFIVQGTIDRDHIGIAAEALIELLDAIDGDPDLDGQCTEDEISTGFQYVPSHSAGCPIMDPGGDEHDGCEEEAGI